MGWNDGVPSDSVQMSVLLGAEEVQLRLTDTGMLRVESHDAVQMVELHGSTVRLIGRAGDYVMTIPQINAERQAHRAVNGFIAIPLSPDRDRSRMLSPDAPEAFRRAVLTGVRPTYCPNCGSHRPGWKSQRSAARGATLYRLNCCSMATEVTDRDMTLDYGLSSIQTNQYGSVAVDRMSVDYVEEHTLDGRTIRIPVAKQITAADAFYVGIDPVSPTSPDVQWLRKRVTEMRALARRQ